MTQIFYQVALCKPGDPSLLRFHALRRVAQVRELTFMAPREIEMNFLRPLKILSEQISVPFEIIGELPAGHTAHEAINALIEAHQVWMDLQHVCVGGIFHIGTLTTPWMEGGETGTLHAETKLAFMMRGYCHAEDAAIDMDRLASLASCLATWVERSVGRNKVYLCYMGRVVAIKV
jgi:hypothetical protein